MLNAAEIPDSLESELARAVRGSRSQEAIRRRLGASYNIVSRWERGSTRVTWSDFVELCRHCKVDLRESLLRILRYEGAIDQPGDVLRHLQGSLPTEKICQAVGVSQATWSRWVTGKTEPALSEVLLVMSINRGILLAFLESLVDPGKLTCLQKEFEDRERLRELMGRHPSAFVLPQALELEEYKALSEYRPGTLARLMGITLSEENQILERLTEAGMLRWTNGRPEISRIPEPVFFRANTADREVRRYWTGRLVDYLHALDGNPPAGRAVANYFSCSEEAFGLIQSEIAHFFRRVEAIRAADTLPHRAIHVLWVQLFDIAETRSRTQDSQDLSQSSVQASGRSK